MTTRDNSESVPQIAVREYQPERDAEAGRTMTYREVNEVANQLARVFVTKAKLTGHENPKVVFLHLPLNSFIVP